MALAPGLQALRHRLRATLAVLPLLVLAPLSACLLAAAPVNAGPVSWVEVPPTAAGRQWWDEGSLRLNRDGRLTVLSRFQPAVAATSGDRDASAPTEADRPQRPPAASLYVMELDCQQGLYRDTSVNGLPRFGAEWQPTGRDDLTAAVLQQACAAHTDALSSR